MCRRRINLGCVAKRARTFGHTRAANLATRSEGKRRRPERVAGRRRHNSGARRRARKAKAGVLFLAPLAAPAPHLFPNSAGFQRASLVAGASLCRVLAGAPNEPSLVKLPPPPVKPLTIIGFGASSIWAPPSRAPLFNAPANELRAPSPPSNPASCRRRRDDPDGFVCAPLAAFFP